MTVSYLNFLVALGLTAWAAVLFEQAVLRAEQYPKDRWLFYMMAGVMGMLTLVGGASLVLQIAILVTP